MMVVESMKRVNLSADEVCELLNLALLAKHRKYDVAECSLHCSEDGVFTVAAELRTDHEYAEKCRAKMAAERRGGGSCKSYTPCGHPCVKCGQVDCLCVGGDGRYKRCSRNCNRFGKPAQPTTATPLDHGPDALYPCRRDGCKVMRTKAEGGTTFTVCDKHWDEAQSTPDNVTDLAREVCMSQFELWDNEADHAQWAAKDDNGCLCKRIANALRTHAQAETDRAEWWKRELDVPRAHAKLAHSLMVSAQDELSALKARVREHAGEMDDELLALLEDKP